MEAIQSTVQCIDVFYAIDDEGVAFLHPDAVTTSTKRFGAMNLLRPIVIDTSLTAEYEAVIPPIYQKKKDNGEQSVLMFACTHAPRHWYNQWNSRTEPNGNPPFQSAMRMEIERLLCSGGRRHHERPQQMSIGIRSSQATPAVRVEIGGKKVFVSQR